MLDDLQADDASAAMRAVLAIAAGVDGVDTLPVVVDDSTTVTVSWDPEEVADHTGVTATFGAPWAVRGTRLWVTARPLRAAFS